MTSTLRSWWKESAVIFTLAPPIIANGMLESGVGFFNVFLIAHLGKTALAANALTSSLFITLMVVFWGLISAISVIIAHYHGARNEEGIAGSLRAGIVVALALSLPTMLLLWFAPQFFRWMGQPPSLIAQASGYLHALTWAVPGDLIGFALMQLFPGLSRPKITFYFSVLYVPLILLLNYLFMFGKWGLPRLELAGVGWGTTIAYTFILILNILYIAQHPYYRHLWQKPVARLKPYIRELLRVGLPLGFTYSIEVGYLFIFALLIGKIGDTTLAAYQIVIQYFWISAVMVGSFGQALTIRLSWHLGQKKSEWINPLLGMGQLFILLYSLVIFYLCYRLPLHLIAFDLGYYPSLKNTFIQQTVIFFHLLAWLQLFDNIRSIGLSILRALKDTRAILLVAVFTYMGIALPIGYILGFIRAPGDACGLWLGAIIGNAVAVLFTFLRLYYLRNFRTSYV